MDLIVFLFKAAGLFLLCMWLFYKDAIRQGTPKGMLAALMSSFTKIGWKAEDLKGPRGLVVRQNLLIRSIAGFVLTVIYMISWAIFWWLFSSTDVADIDQDHRVYDPFSGIAAFFILVGVAMLASYLSHLWPKVRAKANELKDEAAKATEGIRKDIRDEVKKTTDDIRNGFEGNGRSAEKPPIITPPPSSTGEKKPDVDPRKGIDDYIGK